MLEIADLHNPEGFRAILTKQNEFIEAGDNQGFQFFYSKTKQITKAELWQKLDDGRLLKVKGWAKSIIAFF